MPRLRSLVQRIHLTDRRRSRLDGLMGGLGYRQEATHFDRGWELHPQLLHCHIVCRRPGRRSQCRQLYTVPCPTSSLARNDAGPATSFVSRGAHLPKVQTYKSRDRTDKVFGPESSCQVEIQSPVQLHKRRGLYEDGARPCAYGY
ncbi:hypothetical protein LshimejAT787_0900880 [Lyophyllum shimeji]|uniref:Uncharacterized protein n=1 Tax=Lyophyllum shimeji TaxID=47721 RepID=A0A9P3PRU1_LYOSH|nr:hypothetical protein LshimejAT787_0900880 [Lyophyllum shimeji]